MERRNRDWHAYTLAGALAALLAAADAAVADQAEPTRQKSAEKLASFTSTVQAAKPLDRDHPLYPALELAENALDSIERNIDDYTCTLVRRERIGGKVGKHEFIRAKVRHEQTDKDEHVPFSVFLQFQKPSTVEGREALYIEGDHGGRVLVRRGGQRSPYMTSYIKPDSRLAMKENRYPITDIGFQRMVERLIDILHNDMQYDECEVNFYKGAKVANRTCTRIEVIHPHERDHFTFHKATVFVDDKDKLPVGYVSFYWPRNAGEKPRLLEEYIYTDIELNVGLTDEDFDRDNPDYLLSQRRGEIKEED